MKLRWLLSLTLLIFLCGIAVASEDDSDEGPSESSATELEEKRTGNPPGVVAGTGATEEEENEADGSEEADTDDGDDDDEGTEADDSEEADTDDGEETNSDDSEATTSSNDEEATTTDDEQTSTTDEGIGMDNDSQTNSEDGTKMSPDAIPSVVKDAGQEAKKIIENNSLENVHKVVNALYLTAKYTPGEPVEKKLLDWYLEAYSAGIADNVKMFRSVFKEMFDNQIPPHIIAQVLQGSHLKMSPEAVEACLQSLSTELEAKYFGKVFHVLGEYFGWNKMSYYLTGDFLPASWDDAKTAIARTLIAINSDDCEEIRDINAAIEEGEEEEEADNSKVVKDGYAIAFEEGREALSRSSKMLEFLDLMRPVLESKINEKAVGTLTVEHLEHMADHNRTSLSYALGEILSRKDPAMTGAVLEHLARPSIGTPQNVDIFIRILIDDEIPPSTLGKYLAKLSAIPENVFKLGPEISFRLSRLNSVRNYLHILKVIMEVTKRDPVQMIPVVEASNIEDCNRAVGVVYLALLTKEPRSLKSAWKLIDDDKFKECSPRRLVSALETAVTDIPRVPRSWSGIFKTKLRKLPGAFELVKEEKVHYPNVAKMIGV